MNRFFHSQVSARPLGFFRVLWGGFLIYYYLGVYWLLNLYYGTGGLKFMEGLTGPAPEIIYSGNSGPLLQWSLFFWVDQSNLIFHGLYALVLLASLGMMLGRYTRVCSVIVFFCTISFQTPAWWGTNSADQLVKIMSFLFMVASLGGYATRYYSLDARQIKSANKGSVQEPSLMPVWPYRLFQVQLCMVYFTSALQKSGSVDWQSGRAMEMVFLQTNSWMRFDPGLSEYSAFTALITIGVLLWELTAFPVFVWIKSMRLWVLASGVLFHLGIVILFKVFVFTEIMIVIYCCFLSESQVKWVVDRLSAMAARFKPQPESNTLPAS